jgi:hypothetical protein
MYLYVLITKEPSVASASQLNAHLRGNSSESSNLHVKQRKPDPKIKCIYECITKLIARVEIESRLVSHELDVMKNWQCRATTRKTYCPFLLDSDKNRRMHPVNDDFEKL